MDKKTGQFSAFALLFPVLLMCALLSGCGLLGIVTGTEIDEPSAITIVSEPDPDYDVSNSNGQLGLARSMMELDYKTMTVTEFNATIEKLCDDAGATVPGVYADVAEEFRLPGDDHGPPRYNDAKLEDFMTDTLLYSSIEIHAAHANQTAAHSNTIMYITVPGMTAKETAAILEGDAEEAMRFTEDNAAVLNIYPLLIYNVEWDIHNMDAITVAERDSRINDIHSEIKEYWLGMSLEEIASETLESEIAAEFARISQAYSDDKMTIDCVIQSIEFDISRRIDNDREGGGRVSDNEPAYEISHRLGTYDLGTQSIAVDITNPSDMDGSFARDYRIERQTNEGWAPLPLEIIVTWDMIALPAGETTTQSYNLHQDQYEYEPGTYRFVFSNTLNSATASSRRTMAGRCCRLKLS